MSFSNGQRPGGNYTTGTGSQEESLLRSIPMLYQQYYWATYFISQYGPWAACLANNPNLITNPSITSYVNEGTKYYIEHWNKTNKTSTARDLATTIIANQAFIVRDNKNSFIMNHKKISCIPVTVFAMAAPDINPDHSPKRSNDTIDYYKSKDTKHAPQLDQMELIHELYNDGTEEKSYIKFQTVAIQNLIKAAIINKIDHLIIGNWGLGAFMNKNFNKVTLEKNIRKTVKGMQTINPIKVYYSSTTTTTKPHTVPQAKPQTLSNYMYVSLTNTINTKGEEYDDKILKTYANRDSDKRVKDRNDYTNSGELAYVPLKFLPDVLSRINQTKVLSADTMMSVVVFYEAPRVDTNDDKIIWTVMQETGWPPTIYLCIEK